MHTAVDLSLAFATYLQRQVQPQLLNGFTQCGWRISAMAISDKAFSP